MLIIDIFVVNCFFLHYIISSEPYPRIVRMMEFCELCGKLAHREKVRRDQCRLFTAILGRGWGLDSCDNIQPDKEFKFEKNESMDMEEESYFTPDTSFSD